MSSPTQFREQISLPGQTHVAEGPYDQTRCTSCTTPSGATCAASRRRSAPPRSARSPPGTPWRAGGTGSPRSCTTITRSRTSTSGRSWSGTPPTTARPPPRRCCTPWRRSTARSTRPWPASRRRSARWPVIRAPTTATRSTSGSRQSGRRCSSTCATRRPTPCRTFSGSPRPRRRGPWPRARSAGTRSRSLRSWCRGSPRRSRTRWSRRSSARAARCSSSCCACAGAGSVAASGRPSGTLTSGVRTSAGPAAPAASRGMRAGATPGPASAPGRPAGPRPRGRRSWPTARAR